MSQPAVSDLVRRLEEELHAKLFVRGSRALRLTSAGEQLLPHAEQSVTSAELGEKAVRSQQELGGGTATFGLLRNADYYFRADLAKRFRRRYPKVRVRLIGQNSAETAGDVAAGVLEAGLVTLPIDDDAMDVLPLARDEVVYVSANPEHTRTPPTIESCCSAALVLYDAHYATSDPARRQLHERAQMAGTRLEPVIEVEYLGTALELVSEGFGDSMLCRAATAASTMPPGLHTISFAEPMFDTLAFIKRRGQILSPATRELVRLAWHSLVEHQSGPDATAQIIADELRVRAFLG